MSGTWAWINDQRDGDEWETPQLIPIVGDPDCIADESVHDAAWKLGRDIEADGGHVLAISAPQAIYDAHERRVKVLVGLLYQARRYEAGEAP